MRPFWSKSEMEEDLKMAGKKFGWSRIQKKINELARSCPRFEYDESGLGKLATYGYNCTTCTHNGMCKDYARLREKY